MGVSIEKIANRPIIQLTFDDYATGQNVLQAYMQGMDLVQAIPGCVFYIVDIRYAPTSYEHIVSTIHELARGLVGAGPLPAIEVVYVGTAMQRATCHNAPFFETPDAAQGYAEINVPTEAVRAS